MDGSSWLVRQPVADLPWCGVAQLRQGADPKGAPGAQIFFLKLRQTFPGLILVLSLCISVDSSVARGGAVGHGPPLECQF